jgi:hypothetical protein
MTTSDLFAREPSIDVFCWEFGPPIIDAAPQTTNKDKLKIPFIQPP